MAVETDSVNGDNDDAEATADDDQIGDETAESKTNIKRLVCQQYHNFSPNILAHDYLAY